MEGNEGKVEERSIEYCHNILKMSTVQCYMNLPFYFPLPPSQIDPKAFLLSLFFFPCTFVFVSFNILLGWVLGRRQLRSKTLIVLVLCIVSIACW
jgi:hypothetical protein